MGVCEGTNIRVNDPNTDEPTDPTDDILCSSACTDLFGDNIRVGYTSYRDDNGDCQCTCTNPELVVCESGFSVDANCQCTQEGDGVPSIEERQQMCLDSLTIAESVQCIGCVAGEQVSLVGDGQCCNAITGVQTIGAACNTFLNTPGAIDSNCNCSEVIDAGDIQYFQYNCVGDSGSGDMSTGGCLPTNGTGQYATYQDCLEGCLNIEADPIQSGATNCDQIINNCNTVGGTILIGASCSGTTIFTDNCNGILYACCS